MGQQPQFPYVLQLRRFIRNPARFDIGGERSRGSQCLRGQYPSAPQPMRPAHLPDATRLGCGNPSPNVPLMGSGTYRRDWRQIAPLD